MNYFSADRAACYGAGKVFTCVGQTSLGHGMRLKFCKMAPTERVASLLVLRKLCSTFFYIVTLLAQEILSVIKYSREELLDIRATSTYQHYDQEYDFPEADPLFAPPPRALDLIPEADPKQCHRRRGRRSDLLVRFRMRAHTHCFRIYYSPMCSL
jgi:hypothetical protein